MMTLSSATLELASICLTAVINCTNSRLSMGVFFATAIDNVLLCGTYMLFDLIWFVIFSLHIIGWRLSVSIKDMSCYAINIDPWLRRTCRHIGRRAASDSWTCDRQTSRRSTTTGSCRTRWSWPSPATPPPCAVSTGAPTPELPPSAFLYTDRCPIRTARAVAHWKKPDLR